MLLKGGNAETILRSIQARVAEAQAAAEARDSGTPDPQPAVQNTVTASAKAGQTEKKGVTFDETSKQPTDGPLPSNKSRQ